MSRYVIGLTGNIASGKSAVARRLTELGAAVYDADKVAHEVMAAGSPEVGAIGERFGVDVIGDDGSIDRAALGRVVFADPVALADLEAIVHPGVRRRLIERVRSAAEPVAVMEAIKLIEGPLVDHVDAVWVVAAPRDLRIKRLMTERGLSQADATTRVDAQNPEAEKIRCADLVFHNVGTLADLMTQVDAAWQELQQNPRVGALGGSAAGRGTLHVPPIRAQARDHGEPTERNG